MKKTLLLIALTATLNLNAQTVQFVEDFESGLAFWTFSGSGNNLWNSDAIYDGFPPFIMNTPSQPAGINGGPFSSYMHIVNTDICGGAGVCNANYDANEASNQSAISPVINLSGVNTSTVSFWYLCNGEAGSDIGTFQYSTDNGGTWSTYGTYQGVNAWTQVTAAIPALDNQSQVKIRFNWTNDASGSGTDSPFSVDDVTITGNAGAPTLNTTTNSITQLSYCSGVSTPLTVNFNAAGTATSGNVYSAQLSDASGMFTAPTVIGTLASVASGALTINATIPGTTPVGTGYRVRVMASAPTGTSSDNGANISINAAPTISISGNPADGVMCATESVVLAASGADTYVWSPAGALSSSTTPNVIANPAVTTQYTVIGTAQNGCVNSATFIVTVEDCSSLLELTSGFSVYPNPAKEYLYLDNANGLQLENVQVIGLNGQFVNTPINGNEINVSSLAAGQYKIVVQHSNGITLLGFQK